jgi:opine dehydrogenase
LAPGADSRDPGPLRAVTTDPAEALAWSATLICSVPSYAHRPFIDDLAPHLRPGHLLALPPGNLGSLAVARALPDTEMEGAILAGSDTAPYGCRKSAPDRAVIWGTVTGPPGVVPAELTAFLEHGRG